MTDDFIVLTFTIARGSTGLGTWIFGPTLALAFRNAIRAFGYHWIIDLYAGVVGFHHETDVSLSNFIHCFMRVSNHRILTPDIPENLRTFSVCWIEFRCSNTGIWKHWMNMVNIIVNSVSFACVARKIFEITTGSVIRRITVIFVQFIEISMIYLYRQWIWLTEFFK